MYQAKTDSLTKSPNFKIKGHDWENSIVLFYTANIELMKRIIQRESTG